MKGLLIKDLKLILSQKLYLIMILVIGGIIVAPGGKMSTGFGYITALSVILAVTTINYDSYDNGFCFLFTFPVSRKRYVKEKYVFAMLSSFAVIAVMGAALWGVSAAVHAGTNYRIMDFLGDMWDSYIIVLVTLSLLLPLYLEFGAEKSRYVILIMGGIFMGIFVPFFVEETLDVTGFMGIKRAVLFVLSLLLLAGSYALSCVIMERKDF